MSANKTALVFLRICLNFTDESTFCNATKDAAALAKMFTRPISFQQVNPFHLAGQSHEVVTACLLALLSFSNHNPSTTRHHVRLSRTSAPASLSEKWISPSCAFSASQPVPSSLIGVHRFVWRCARILSPRSHLVE
jgi:hypothetical protein